MVSSSSLLRLYSHGSSNLESSLNNSSSDFEILFSRDTEIILQKNVAKLTSTQAKTEKSSRDDNRTTQISNYLDRMHHLHQACVCSTDNEIFLIDRMLQNDPRDASKQVFLKKPRKVFNCAKKRVETKVVQEQYGYAINLAMKNSCIKDTDVLERIILSDQSVIIKPDGPNKEGTLHCLIRYRPSAVDLADSILLKNSDTASMKDTKGNTPLHIAASRPCPSLDLIRHLVILYPHALMERNFNGLTPLDLVSYQSANKNADDVADYLREQMDMYLNCERS